MKPLSLFRPLAGLLTLLMIAQLACGVGSAAPTETPTASEGIKAPAQETQALAATAAGPEAPADAETMLNAAVQHYQQVGREQALKDFNNKKAPFDNSNLPLVCLGSDHKVTAMSSFPLLVGTSADTLKDPGGQPIGELVWEAASVQPQGSVPFHWNNPLTGQEESKMLFYQKLDQDVCGVAADQP